MPQGTVKWFNNVKGYGFISLDDGREVFVHHTDVPDKKRLHDGQRVEVDVEAGPRGEKAVRVRIIAEA